MQTVVVWVSPDDIRRYFPDRVLSSDIAEVLGLAAQRVVNTTLACVGEIRAASCASLSSNGSLQRRVVVVAALRNLLDSEKTARLGAEITTRLRAAALVVGGVDFLDCSQVGAASPAMSMALPGATDVNALEYEAGCLHAHLLQLSISEGVTKASS